MRWILMILLGLFTTFSWSQGNDIEMKRVQWLDAYQAQAEGILREKVVITGFSVFADSMQQQIFIDTFALNSVYERTQAVDRSMLGLNQANMYAAGDYEKLITKYSKILRSKLLPDDRKVFDEEEANWKAYAEKQKALCGVLMQPIYNGGVTSRTILYSNQLKEIQKARLLTILDWLTHLV